ncbi:MAG: hypothetical protein KDD56_06290 [Bdellovibrionales bacterium]|nr:hypothetical protein [Bdellovibrionales bacterium]
MTARESIKPAMTAQQNKFTGEKSALSVYKELAVGDSSWAYFAYCELLQLFLSNLSGFFGFGFRTFLYPSLFKNCGARPAIGRSVLLRNPRSITLGNKVMLDDNAVLDSRGKDGTIVIGDYVSVGRFSVVVAKDSVIELGDGVNISSFCRIATQSKVVIGKSTLVAAYAYIGPGNHQLGDDDIPLISKEMENKGGVEIGEHVWIGTRASILDGVKIGNNAIIGAHSLVKDDVPAGAVVAGTPAKIIGNVNE